jgi:tetratricopeptide (TPR) repeat protein
MQRRSWPEHAVLGAALLIGAFAAGLTPVADGDLYWHLAAGREMVRTHALLTSDPFSVSAAGRPWIDVHWLFQLGVYAVHQLGGLTGLVMVKCLLICAGALLLYLAVHRSARPLFVPILVAALLCARHLLLVRPVIASLVFLAFYFLQLERFRRQGRVGLLVPLCLAQIVWSNCQGLFALGPALVGAYTLGTGAWAAWGARPWFPFAAEGSSPRLARRQLGALTCVLSFCILGALLTPYGVHALRLPIELFARLLPGTSNPYLQVAENVPPFAMERIAPGQFWHLKWFLGSLVLACALSPRRLRLSHGLLIIGFAALALMSNRNVLLLYWVASPILALQLAPIVRRAAVRWRRYRMPSVARWLEAVVLSSLLLAGLTAAARESRLSEPVPFRFPTQSARVIEGIPGQGTIFSADDQGGYLIWQLYPRFRPYIDTRLVLRTRAQFSEYLDLLENPQRFDAFQRRNNFGYVVLPVSYPDRYLHLAAHLYQSSEWKLIFTNGSEVLFARRGVSSERAWDLGSGVTTDRLLGEIDHRFGGSSRLLEAARIQLATLDIAVGKLDQAERVLSNATSPAGLALKARSRLADGDLEGARAIGERLLHMADDDVRNLDLMAMVYMRRGQLQPAARLLRRALAIDPFDNETTSLLGTMERYAYGP